MHYCICSFLGFGLCFIGSKTSTRWNVNWSQIKLWIYSKKWCRFFLLDYQILFDSKNLSLYQVVHGDSGSSLFWEDSKDKNRAYLIGNMYEIEILTCKNRHHCPDDKNFKIAKSSFLAIIPEYRIVTLCTKGFIVVFLILLNGTS